MLTLSKAVRAQRLGADIQMGLFCNQGLRCEVRRVRTLEWMRRMDARAHRSYSKCCEAASADAPRQAAGGGACVRRSAGAPRQDAENCSSS